MTEQIKKKFLGVIIRAETPSEMPIAHDLYLILQSVAVPTWIQMCLAEKCIFDEKFDTSTLKGYIVICIKGVSHYLESSKKGTSAKEQTIKNYVELAEKILSTIESIKNREKQIYFVTGKIKKDGVEIPLIKIYSVLIHINPLYKTAIYSDLLRTVADIIREENGLPPVKDMFELFKTLEEGFIRENDIGYIG